MVSISGAGGSAGGSRRSDPAPLPAGDPPGVHAADPGGPHVLKVEDFQGLFEAGVQLFLRQVDMELLMSQREMIMIQLHPWDWKRNWPALSSFPGMQIDFGFDTI